MDQIISVLVFVLGAFITADVSVGIDDGAANIDRHALCSCFGQRIGGNGKESPRHTATACLALTKVKGIRFSDETRKQ